MTILRALVFTLNVSLLAACATEPSAATGDPTAGLPGVGDEGIGRLANDPPHLGMAHATDASATGSRGLQGALHQSPVLSPPLTSTPKKC